MWGVELATVGVRRSFRLLPYATRAISLNKRNRGFADMVVSYFGGLPALVLLYGYLLERKFRRAWILEHPVLDLSDGMVLPA